MVAGYKVGGRVVLFLACCNFLAEGWFLNPNLRSCPAPQVSFILSEAAVFTEQHNPNPLPARLAR